MDSFGSKIPFFFNISHQSIEKVPAGKYRFRKSSTENLKDFWLIYFPLLNIQNVQIVWGNIHWFKKRKKQKKKKPQKQKKKKPKKKKKCKVSLHKNHK